MKGLIVSIAVAYSPSSLVPLLPRFMTLRRLRGGRSSRGRRWLVARCTQGRRTIGYSDGEPALVIMN